MDLAKTLIRTVARGFYEVRQVLIIDALLVHSALNNSDLSTLMNTNPKDLRKSCGKLKEDKMMMSHSRQETREGQTRPINIDYYYIDFHIAIDAIKYRVTHLSEKVQEMYQPSEERKEYYCPRCEAEWTTMEVLDKAGPFGFECKRCGSVLEQNDRSQGDSTGHEKHSKLMGQLKKILMLLKQIDSMEIPKNDFEAAFSVAVPIQRNEQINPSRATVPINGAMSKPVTVKGMTQAAAPLAISLTTASEKTAAEQAAEAVRKAAIAAQNQLPQWISTSTVTGEISAAGMRERERTMTNTNLGVGKIEEDEKKDVKTGDDELTQFFADMAREKELERLQQDEDEDDEDEDDDEADFEDVAVDGSLPANTIGASNGLLNGALKHLDMDSGSSTPGTGFSTPAGSQNMSTEIGNPPSKKLKMEENGNGAPAVQASAPLKDSDDYDEADFEDAL